MRVLDALVALVALVALPFPLRHWTWVATGLAAGALARFAASRGAMRSARVIDGLALVAVGGRAALVFGAALAYVHGIGRVAALAVAALGYPLLAGLVTMRGPRWAPVAAGMLWAQAGWWPTVATDTSAVLLAFALGRGALGPSPEPARQRIASFGAGAVGAIAAIALAFDLALASRVVPDAWALPRMALEVATVVAALDAAAGRTRGLLALTASSAALVTLSLVTALPRDVIWWCMGQPLTYFHPFHAHGWIGSATHRPWLWLFGWLVYQRPPLVLGLALAIAPWALPIARALRSGLPTPSP